MNVAWLNVFALIGRWWRKRQRDVDLRVLWPACKEEALGDLEHARTAFFLHCMMDPAWTHDLSEKQIEAFVENLK